MTSKPDSPAKAKPASRRRAKAKSPGTGAGKAKPARAQKAAEKSKVVKKKPTPAAAKVAENTADGAILGTDAANTEPSQETSLDENKAATAATPDTPVADDTPAGSAYQTEAPRIVPPRSKVTGAARGFAWFTLVLALVVAVGAVTWPYWSERFASALPFLKSGEQRATAITALTDRLQALEQKTDDLAAAKSETLKQLESERARIGEELKAMIGRLDEVETSVRETRGLLKAGEAREKTQEATKSLKVLSERLAALEKSGGRYGELEARVAQVEKGQTFGAGEPDPKINADLADVKARVGRLENARPSAAGNAGARAIVLAVAQLRDSVRRGLPLADDLDALKAVAGDNADISSAVTKLTKYVATGVPTVASLRARFSTMAGTVVAAGNAGETEGWIGQAVAKITSLVRIRRVGEAAPPGSLDAIVAEVDSLLAAGALTEAVDKLAKVEGKAAQAVAPWLIEARARLEAEKAVASLHVHAVSLLAPAKAGG